VESCWEQLSQVIDVDDVMPITYVNSAADLKAFCGKHGGIVCTSANARAVLNWAFERRSRVLFFPDQHLGRNTSRAMGIPLEQMPLWDPRGKELGGNTREAIRNSRVILWQGHCSVHQVFLPQHIAQFREKHPGIKILVHPECMMDVVDQADVVGSTGPAGNEMGHRHRVASGQPAQAAASRAGDPLPVTRGVHVFDDVPHRSAASLLGVGKPGRRHAGQRHPGRAGNGQVGVGIPDEDA
jgi:hypothetical protein